MNCQWWLQTDRQTDVLHNQTDWLVITFVLGSNYTVLGSNYTVLMF